MLENRSQLVRNRLTVTEGRPKGNRTSSESALEGDATLVICTGVHYQVLAIYARLYLTLAYQSFQLPLETPAPATTGNPKNKLADFPADSCCGARIR
jgi:hypothetical protein